jgi:hypothetical protein
MQTTCGRGAYYLRSASWSIAATMSLSLCFAAQGDDETGAKDIKLASHIQKEFGDIPGKEGLMMSVEFPPG